VCAGKLKRAGIALNSKEYSKDVRVVAFATDRVVGSNEWNAKEPGNKSNSEKYPKDAVRVGFKAFTNVTRPVG